MVGVKGMSQIAGCMESALDRIREGNLALSSEAFAAMGATADRFDQYCLQLRQGLPVEEEALLDQTVADFGKIGSGPGEPIMPMLDGDFLEEVEGLTADPMGFVADDELLGEFRAEAEEHLEELSQAMQYLESHIAGPTPISGQLREVVQKFVDPCTPSRAPQRSSGCLILLRMDTWLRMCWTGCMSRPPLWTSAW